MGIPILFKGESLLKLSWKMMDLEPAIDG